jgi:hypothetical protein
LNGKRNRAAFGVLGGTRVGAADMLGEPHPGLRQRQPQRLVIIVVGTPCHRDALLCTFSMILHGPHRTIPELYARHASI